MFSFCGDFLVFFYVLMIFMVFFFQFCILDFLFVFVLMFIINFIFNLSSFLKGRHQPNMLENWSLNKQIHLFCQYIM